MKQTPMGKLLKLIACLVMTSSLFSQNLTPTVSTSSSDTLFTFTKSQTKRIVKSLVVGADCNLMSYAKSEVIGIQDSLLDARNFQIAAYESIQKYHISIINDCEKLNRTFRRDLLTAQYKAKKYKRQRNVFIGFGVFATSALLISTL